MDRLKNTKNKALKASFMSESLFKMLFKDCPDGYIYKDSNLQYKYANESFCKIFGIKNFEKIINKNEMFNLSEENKELIKKVNDTVALELRSINFIMNFCSGDKEKILNITTTPIIDNGIFSGIISLIKDITYEEKIKEKFVFKHYQLKSLLENVPLIIYMQDKDLNFVAGTKQSKQFVDFGYDYTNDIHLNWNNFKNENSSESLHVLKANKPLIKEKQIQDNKGCPHWYRICKFPIRDLKCNVNGLITFADNIDNAKQLQNQRETFVATLGHDLKNPTLAQIRSLELLLNGSFGALTSAQSELVEMILDSCRYMNGMLASLLTTYRNLDGIIKLQFEEFSFPDLVTECVSEMIYVAKDKNIKISINSSFDTEVINADRVQLKRVIMNLLSNGIKYAYKDSFLILRIKVSDKQAEFEFENESPYIPLEKQKAIFAQYVTYAGNYNELGIGLGLYASQKIVESHQGKIYLESFTDNKNKFGFKIPTKPKPECFEKNVYF
ncbi:PAS domain S-box protein [bacterium]|nr:PAS domain S-box protein [bacterium]